MVVTESQQCSVRVSSAFNLYDSGERGPDGRAKVTGSTGSVMSLTVRVAVY